MVLFWSSFAQQHTVAVWWKNPFDNWVEYEVTSPCILGNLSSYAINFRYATKNTGSVDGKFHWNRFVLHSLAIQGRSIHGCGLWKRRDSVIWIAIFLTHMNEQSARSLIKNNEEFRVYVSSERCSLISHTHSNSKPKLTVLLNRMLMCNVCCPQHSKKAIFHGSTHTWTIFLRCNDKWAKKKLWKFKTICR